MITLLKSQLGLLLGLFIVSLSFAQNNNPNEKLPLNSKVKHGVLDNGITYYVLHNEEPEDRASFYIVQNVGAILENDNQNGLAHFLEHMAFNGTKNYPDKGILDYLQSYGVASGQNINAYTSVDETVYNLSDIPTTNQNLIDSTLLILHDWCDYLLLTDEELDNERGVIHEEWRTRRSGGMRVYLESKKYLFQGSKYAERDVIGSLDVIDNFEYETIRDFYHDWYRTDLQAIIVVGDIDADTIETKIKNLFAEIKPIENPKARNYFEVNGNKEPIVGIITDPEAANIRFMAYYKHKAESFDNKNLAYFRNDILSQLYSNMLNLRFEEILQKGTPPFIFAYAGYYNVARLLDAYTTGCGLKEDNLLGGIESVLIENERVKQFGFLDSELQRAKMAMLSAYEKAYKERNKVQNDDLVPELKNNYLSNEPAMGIEKEYELVQKLIPEVTLAEINDLPKQWITDTNQVFLLTGVEKEGLSYPSKEDILSVVEKVKNAKLTPYQDNTLDEPLIAQEPKAGKVKKVTELADFKANEWILSNGAMVIIKPTNFKENEVLLRAFSMGGSSLYSAADQPSIYMLGSFMDAFGLGNFDQVSLQKKLTGKIVELNVSVDELSENISGSSSINDFETLLQLVYLQFEKPRFDQEAFEALKARYAAYVSNLNADINKAFSDSVNLTISSHSDRTVLFNAETIDKVNFETIKKVYSDRFTDASDFTFILVGNIDIEAAKPLVEKYLGSIKSIKRTETWKDNGVSYPDSNVVKLFEREMQTPKTTIYINWHGKDIEYTAKNRILMNFVSELLNKKYIEIIREQEGGTYGVRVDGRISKIPTSEYYVMAKFDTDPAKADKLKGMVYDEVKNLCEKEIDEVDLEEARNNFIKKREENLRHNGFWLGAINHYCRFNEEIVTPASYEDIVKAITAADVKTFAQKYLSAPGVVEVTMSPKE